MRFYDKDIVAARPNLAFMPFGAGPHRCFGARWDICRCNSCSPSFADPCPDSEAVFARGTPEHRTSSFLESPPCLSGSETPQGQKSSGADGSNVYNRWTTSPATSRQMHSPPQFLTNHCWSQRQVTIARTPRAHQLLRCVKSRQETLPKLRTDPLNSSRVWNVSTMSTRCLENR
jgi:hypothetical protein